MKNKQQPSNKPEVKRRITRREYYLAGAGLGVILGLILTVTYIVTMNMAAGAIGVLMAIVSAFVFHYLWKQNRDILPVHIGETEKAQVNCLNINRDGTIVFTEMLKPEGFLWKCRNDGEHYYTNWQPEGTTIKPFTLPDQQYMDPEVLASRVIELPAHRKIFRRRADLMQKLRPAVLIVVIGILWVLIITTTGQG